MANDLIPESVYDGFGPRAKEYARYFLENPRSSMQQVADHFGVSRQRISTIIFSSRFFRALRMATSKRVQMAAPRAAETLINCLDSTSEDVKLKTSIKILESEGILGGDKLEVTVNDVRNLSLEKLIEIAQEPIDPVMIAAAEKKEPAA